jgi:glycosyltransferase involved in cell wall biosynthesis
MRARVAVRGASLPSLVTPRVTVVIPVFNGEAFVAAAIESALAQTVRDIEVVVVDDGSVDRTAEIVAAQAEADARVVVVQQPNRGLSAARNAGIRRASAPSIAFLDADDRWLPEKLERQLPLLGPRTVVYADAHRVGPNDELMGRISEYLSIDDASFERLLDGNVVPVLTAVIGADLLREVSGFDERLRSAEDWHLWLRLAAAGAIFEYVPEPLAVYQIRPGALSSDPVWMATWRLEALRLLSNELDPALSPSLGARARLERHLLAGELRKAARREPSRRRSARLTLRSLRVDPRGIPGLVRRAVRQLRGS